MGKLGKCIQLLSVVSVLLAAMSCQKEQTYTGSDLPISFSTDTVQFDTIFTTLSSITKSFTVHNRNEKTVKIEQISLQGGDDSPYKLNIDGTNATSVKGVEIQGNDSLYVFVEVTLDPNNAASPMIAEDAITFQRKGNEKKVRLISFGQDVHLVDGEVIGDETWVADKPYLIYNSLLVDTNATLRLAPGAQLYFSQESHLYVAGRIMAEGTLEEPILFSGARIDHDYEDIPGQWEGIWFMPGSSGSQFTHATIKNAIIGMQVDSMIGANPTVTLHNSSILNMTSAAIYARGARIHASNTVLGNCGQYLAALTIGGEYRFEHCTFANYWQYSGRRYASIWLNNYYIDINNQEQARPLNEAWFANCLIYGSRSNEILLDALEGAAFNTQFEGTFARVDNQIPDTEIATDYRNINPRFVDPYENNYQLDTLSPVKDKGLMAPAQRFPFDILGVSRLNDAGPDPGAYERVEDSN